MIESIHCKNFQSLRDVELELGKFTVIVGATSSGKSAFIRALRAIADNALSSDYIMQGAKHTSVAVKTDKATVTIERSAGGSSVYKISDMGGEESSYTKLNRQVPTQVTAALGIVPSTKEVASISFASQHDTPYLLTESSGNAARILGELTNVSTIFAAVREASKRAKAASTVLNLRKKDQEALVSQISSYRDINTQAKAMDAVETLWNEIEYLQQQSSDLAGSIRRAEAASDALRAAKSVSEPPSLDEILSMQKTLSDFKRFLKQVLLASRQMSDLSATLAETEQTVQDTEDQIHKLLTEAGQCPLCLQEVK